MKNGHWEEENGDLASLGVGGLDRLKNYCVCMKCGKRKVEGVPLYQTLDSDRKLGSVILKKGLWKIPFFS